MTFFRFMAMFNVPTNSIRLVRHGNKEIPVLEVFRKNRKRFDAYQSFQYPNRFGGAKQIAGFAPLPSNASLFLGLWDVIDVVPNNELTDFHRALVDEFGFPPEWKQDCDFYVMKFNENVAELSERLVVDWGGGTLQWVQKQDKPVIELKRPHSIGDFTSYSDVKLDFYDVKQLMTDVTSNLTWKKALSSVNGVYLIRDKSTGKMYVGSAYNEDGIYGRWRNYAANGHGGNKLLLGLNPSNFEFSILEITSYTLSDQEVIQIENKWKDRLGTRQFGNLNSN